MQTFLPYPDFTASAKVLDYRRLGKQRIETKQLLMLLLDETERKGWQNHPAKKMWVGHAEALATYGKVICEEWIRRGYKDNQLGYFVSRTSTKPPVMPRWLGDTQFHKSHRSNLLRKDVVYYSKYFNDVDASLEYVWPTP